MPLPAGAIVVSMLEASDIVGKLSRSQIFKDYEKAFCDATELPLTLRSAEANGPALHGHPKENPFCALLADSSKACAECLQNQQFLSEGCSHETKSVRCFAGLYDTAVPVIAGEKVIGFLQTGQVALEKPRKAQMGKMTRNLVKWGSNVDLTKLQEAYFHSKVLPPVQYKSMIRLLEIFADHLSEVANRLILQDEEKDAPIVRRAKAYIGEHHPDPLTLTELARNLHVSTFYFCKMFKKSTGMTFTDYLGRVRVEKAKALLLHADHRVSEIAYEVGFQSLTHFNRLFHRLTGMSPSEYRTVMGPHREAQ